ncbi:DNA cytosine methyltransferase [Kiloniella laminariae]|uniref:DNA cytosine methyltransferase n=1 Tax=Kiloniella laminariae TaxID=454162 RepID=A0ABT4LPQ4_9PROT|nr:DNA cytosine methyltransferase [Kiloniella laminariae]MCZ4283076.1 DNA cytosine methyltransferase [Kiloniella laminariae]
MIKVLHGEDKLNSKLILSVFPGIDMLGKAFEETGFCVVRGPDLITGGDIRNFFPPANVFAGVIGGPPCQDFSGLNRSPGTYGHKMLDEYVRVVMQVNPDWFLFENVARAPSFEVQGFTQQRFALDLGWFTEFSRLRHFVFGSKSGLLLDPVKSQNKSISGGAVTGGDQRSFRACCDIQGLPSKFDLPSFTLAAKKQAVANGVPLQLGRYVAGLIHSNFYGSKDPLGVAEENIRRCCCECGRAVVGRALYASPACRKSAQRKRDKQKSLNGQLARS